MSSGLIQQLIEVIPPPAVPDRVIGSTTNPKLGRSVEVPDDYRLFLDTYGPGAFLEGSIVSVRVFDVVTPDADKDFDSVIELDIRNKPHRPNMPSLFPAVPGLLPGAILSRATPSIGWWTVPPISGQLSLTRDRN